MSVPLLSLALPALSIVGVTLVTLTPFYQAAALASLAAPFGVMDGGLAVIVATAVAILLVLGVPLAVAALAAVIKLLSSVLASPLPSPKGEDI